jgi:hypothetical protein
VPPQRDNSPPRRYALRGCPAVSESAQVPHPPRRWGTDGVGVPLSPRVGDRWRVPRPCRPCESAVAPRKSRPSTPLASEISNLQSPALLSPRARTDAQVSRLCWPCDDDAAAHQRRSRAASEISNLKSAIPRCPHPGSEQHFHAASAARAFPKNPLARAAHRDRMHSRGLAKPIPRGNRARSAQRNRAIRWAGTSSRVSAGWPNPS